MKFLILVIPLLITGCAPRYVDPDTIAPMGYGGPSYVDQIRMEGDLDRAANRLKWYHGR